jgi:hypothetical protein
MPCVALLRFWVLDQVTKSGVLAVEPMLRRTQAPFVKPQHDKPTSEPEKPSKPSRMEQACRIVAEYADDLREILKKFRKLLN